MKKQDKIIPQALREFMVLKDLKQIDLAHKTGLPRSYISMLLSGERVPRIGKLRNICSALGISLSTLFLKASQLEAEKKNTVKKEKLIKAYALLAEIDEELFGGGSNNDEAIPENITPVLSEALNEECAI